MASIRKRIKTDGSVAYIAEIIIKRNKQILHRESRSFSSQKLAKAWASRREIELENTAVYGKQQTLKIAELLQEYTDRFDDYGRSKKQVMNALIRSDLAQINVYQLTGADLIKHCLERRKTAKPQTVKNDMIWLKSALSVIKGLHNYSYSLELFDAANKVMRKEHIIGSVDSRDRRPTNQELWQLSRYFYRMKTPYLHLMWFAIYSARRQTEIMELQWADINHDNKTILVRDMKTPGKKVLNMRLKLPKSAYRLIMRQPQTGAAIFPYNAKSIGTGFTRACRMLHIDNLHFHDLRRHAISRLAETGLSIEQIAQVSGHHDWSSLKIYFHPDPGALDI
jgi:integrase